MRPYHAKPLRYRQIHLDFHTSEHIPAVGAEFDPVEFVEAFKAANVDSVTVFAKCHHGWSYYPTKVGKSHPNLSRPDLLGDMIKALSAADIESPIYLTVQWDELSAREHPEWRVMSATNRYGHMTSSDPSDGRQLTAGWHTLCLNHEALRRYVLDQAREVASRYPTQGLFFDIVQATDCVCAACIARMHGRGLDPLNPVDRRKNDEEVNEQFRREISGVLSEEFPGLRIFYNAGHIDKRGKNRFGTYTHLELESLPTGGWGYDHFPVNARYAATLGLEFVAHTGKFHTAWGDFGGFKRPQALEYECMQMIALGSKCLVGDQLHPSGKINRDTYATIGPAYARVRKLEPFLKGAVQVSEVAILSAEHMDPCGDRNHPSDDGAAQMLLELKQPFDVIDRDAEFGKYRLIILPDVIRIDAALTARLNDYVARGGKLIASWRSGLAENGELALDAGIARGDRPIPFNPSYVKAAKGLDGDLPDGVFVFYDEAESVSATGATVLAEIYPPYFNRSYRHFSSHLQTPDDPAASPLGAAVTEYNGIAYVAYPLFRLYQSTGQPLYKYVVRGLLDRLLPARALTTDLPSAGRATLTSQPDERRHVLHLLYAAPQVRGKQVRDANGSSRIMEMIEDVPAIGPVTAAVRLPRAPSRVYDAYTGANLAWSRDDGGRVSVTLPRLHIHAAVVFEGA
ncbi:hypothetical protein BLA6860_07034 [Burkholderia lata]|uniref:beta-galactosidase trimerization domain-containing protein n=1 Tax=Burkholderia lata (strain ATCC 17760 / DSM 23089 / LMG 22485 / NCIMB 9086 / R18194 / 383) TaxID=482957 RepID=UPI0014533654|nr:beta-galactosidase trimerization domain-containing protein [Burkholderia lata]VWC41664.1 hypothetical protein BLA6860_07034 [Burkholderia lata]